jgi:hypothetical protein
MLLVFRRTTTIGAMLMVFVSGTVWLLDAIMNRGGITGNALWDALMAVALLVPVLPRLENVYVRNRAVPELNEPPLLAGRWVRALKWMLVAYFLYQHATLWGRFGFLGDYYRDPHPLSGVFEVRSETRNGQPIRLRHDDSTQWAFVALGASAHGSSLRGTDGPATALYALRSDGSIAEGYRIEIDTSRQVIKVDTTQHPEPLEPLKGLSATGARVRVPMEYRQTDRNSMLLRAIIAGDTVELVVHRMPTHKSVLFGSPRLAPSRYGRPPW